MSSTAYNRFIQQMDYLGDATDMGTSPRPSTCSSAIDVVGQNVNLPSGALGVATCINKHSNQRCDRTRVQVDEAYIATLPYPSTTLRQTVCHEIGHSAGFSHYKDADGDYPAAPDGQSDCMISGILPSSDPVWFTYSQHHKNHINPYYT